MSTVNATQTVPARVATYVKSATQRRFGAAAVKSRFSRSFARSWPGPVPGTVVRSWRPRRAPHMPLRRITRSTVQRATRLPRRLSSSHVLRAPYTSSYSVRIRRISATISASRTARAEGGLPAAA
jgi:hypothetical protein